MKATTTKTMTKFIKKFVKETGIAEDARQIWVREYNYPIGCKDDPFSRFDYDWKTRKYRVIEVSYPYECYCEPIYLSTPVLNSECKRRNVKTEEEFKELLKDLIEI